MATAPLIELDQVSKSFDGGRTFALRDVSLAVEAGAFGIEPFSRNFRLSTCGR
jgi:ABC-type Fe3+/spermidine/putrescine transport system ATPase subunit